LSPEGKNCDLTKSGQKLDFLTFVTTTRVSADLGIAKILKIQNFLKIDNISMACRVNPPRSGVYFWTLFYP
jgi:hypothetical protein